MTRSHPQRIFHHLAPGALLKQVAVTAQPRKVDLDQDVEHLANIRQCPCLHCGMDPCYEAAHLRMASAAYGKASGLGKRPPAKWALPLCPEHHRLAKNCQHDRSEQSFWHELGINPLICCEQLYAQRGDLVAMRAVVMVTIAGRGRT